VSWTPESLHHPLWAEAASALGKPVAGAISINPSETQIALLRLMTAAACAWLGLQLGLNPRWAYRIVVAIAISGTFYAMYGLLLRAAHSETVLWIDKSYLDFPNQLTGQFINPNSFAAYINIGLACALALFFRSIRHGFSDHGLTGSRRWLAAGLNLTSSAALYTLLIVPLFTALVLSRSRAGFFLALLAGAALLLIEYVRGRLHGGGWGLRGTLIALAVAIGGCGVILANEGAYLAEKLAGSSGSDIGDRLKIAKIVARAIADRPLTGFGYGTFADVFPLYRDATVTMYERYFEAHNSYLEALLGLGIPMAAVFFAGLGYMVFRCFWGVLQRRRDYLAPVAATAASVVIGLHVLVDFSIQLEGIAMTYAGLLGAGFAQSWSSRAAGR
jgi:O-antigen ligase